MSSHPPLSSLCTFIFCQSYTAFNNIPSFVFENCANPLYIKKIPPPQKNEDFNILLKIRRQNNIMSIAIKISLPASNTNICFIYMVCSLWGSHTEYDNKSSSLAVLTRVHRRVQGRFFYLNLIFAHFELIS